MQLTNKGDPSSVHIDLYNLAELNDLKFKIKMFRTNHQIILFNFSLGEVIFNVRIIDKINKCFRCNDKIL